MIIIFFAYLSFTLIDGETVDVLDNNQIIQVRVLAFTAKYEASIGIGAKRYRGVISTSHLFVHLNINSDSNPKKNAKSRFDKRNRIEIVLDEWFVVLLDIGTKNFCIHQGAQIHQVHVIQIFSVCQ